MKLTSKRQWRCNHCEMQFVDNSDIDFPLCAPPVRMAHGLVEVSESSHLYVEGAMAHFKFKA